VSALNCVDREEASGKGDLHVGNRIAPGVDGLTVRHRHHRIIGEALNEEAAIVFWMLLPKLNHAGIECVESRRVDLLEGHGIYVDVLIREA
jgi:hypothetical protein